MSVRVSPLPAEAIGFLRAYFNDIDLDRIRIYHGIPWYVIGNPDGYTDRYRIYIDPASIDAGTEGWLALLAHELVHARQYQLYGTWQFRFRYIYYYFRNRFTGMSHSKAYSQVPYEIEAREVEMRVLADLQS